MLSLPPAVIEKVSSPFSKAAVVRLWQMSNALLRSKFAFVFDHRMVEGTHKHLFVAPDNNAR